MTEYITGANAVINWVWTGGTVNLAGDYRGISTKESTSTVDTTAGTIRFETHLPTLKSATADYNGLFPAGGTALYAALAAGNQGTLIVAPEGTATGKLIKTYPATSLGATIDTPYNEVVTINCSFKSNGAWS